MAAPLILGINAYHADAAACIVRDGQLLAAAEEERFRPSNTGPGSLHRRSNTACAKPRLISAR